MSQKTEEFSIEASMSRLEEIAKLLEAQETTLKDSLALYTEGVGIIDKCKDILCDAEKEMIILTKKGENSD